MHRLAGDLGVGLDLIPIERQRFAEHLDDGWCDLIATGLTITPERARQVTFSMPYLTDGLGVVVSDAQRKAFANTDKVRARSDLRVAVLSGLSLYEQHIEQQLPKAEIVRLDHLDAFFASGLGKEPADALVTLAMIGSAYTLLHPSYTLVVPKPVVKVPVALALPRNDQALKEYIDNWLLLEQLSGELQALYDHWVLGEAVKAGEPRWSVIRNVFGWVD